MPDYQEGAIGRIQPCDDDQMTHGLLPIASGREAGLQMFDSIACDVRIASTVGPKRPKPREP